MTEPLPSWRLATACALLALTLAQPATAQVRQAVRNGDYIVAVINQELVTAGEVDRRVEQAQAQAAQNAAVRLPPEDQLRRQALDALIEERVIVTYARDIGVRIDDLDLDRAVQSVAQQNQLTLDQLRERLRQDGIDFGRFRNNLRDQMMVERIREREVYQREDRKSVV